ncbi:serinethreonine phosphatase [Nitzschia inconspicua]|uniref:Serinethreonine phosphatase n=1 Tax=Nitzschia inconspicua TaxID=303405 RepID=A0A9K3KJ26_9STRA|nr:serinethreonine phosphatase [Nitzschia inconspicua]
MVQRRRTMALLYGLVMTGSIATRGAGGATAASFLNKFSRRRRNHPSFIQTTSGTTTKDGNNNSNNNNHRRLLGWLVQSELLSDNNDVEVDGALDDVIRKTSYDRDSSLSGPVTVAGTIPLREFQHRSISFWSWKGWEQQEQQEEEYNSSNNNSSKKSSSFKNKNKKEKESESSKRKRKQRRDKVSYSCEQGFRTYMEDDYFISKDGDFCCCFDGHGGRAVSRYLKKNLYANVQAFLPISAFQRQTTTEYDENAALVDETQAAIDGLITTANRDVITGPTIEDYATALESALEKIDNEILRLSHWSYQGSTATVIWLLQDPNNTDEYGKPKRTILAANIGDSRAVLCRKDTAWDLTRDHKPNDPIEKQRIESIGGSVIWCGDVDFYGHPIEERGIYRVNGILALSRAIGDRSERPHVTATPDMVAVDVEEGDDFVVLATDGLWDVMDSAEAVEYVKFVLESGLSKEKVASQMVQEALRRGTYDNITVLIIWL